jgi:hypothetical protein
MPAIARMARSYRGTVATGLSKSTANPWQSVDQTNPARKFSSIRSPWPRISPPAR